jgi:DNA segregation ATPase FtsK/SpoIIIE, S-DNA-T family
MPAAGKRTTKRSSKPVAARTAKEGFRVDPRTRHEIFGVALSALAVALTIAVLTDSQSLIPRAVATLLRSAFGIGAFLVPVVVLVWGVSFFIPNVRIDESLVGGGLGIAFLSVISMTAVQIPLRLQWDAATIATRGGYVGGAIAWGLRSLLGVPISYVVLVAVLLIGLLLATGISIGGWIELLQERSSARAEVEPREKAPRQRRTIAMPDFTAATPAPVADRAPTRRASAEDPESRRKTTPAQRVVAPHAMEGFELPAAKLLQRSATPSAAHRASDRELRSTGEIITNTLGTFDIPCKVVAWIPGPTVTMFELEIAPGVKVNRVTALADDLALALAAPTVRILAPIPGKSLIGIEVPNERRSTVTLGDVLGEAPTLEDRSPLVLGIGKDVSGESVVSDLAKMPHLLIAGSTGTGKSVCINALLMSILMRATPSEVRLILIDPKRIELSLYNGLPHLYVPVVTEAKEAASALAWAVSEMEARLKRLQKAGARNIGAYNAMAHEGKLPEGMEEMSYLVIVIDELADLMMVAAKEVEDSICRLAQLARAAGIHLIVATQRPSTDIITGLIKTNITNRIAFAVGSGIDSRVILDCTGAEKLVGLGDMLFSTPAWAKPKRIQGAYVSESEIEAVVSHLKAQAEPDYHEEILHLKVATTGGGVESADGDDDPLLWEAADIVVTSGMGSTSLLQRRLKVGYARAGRIMDMLESKGIVGPPDGSRPREVQADVEELESLKAFERAEGAGE